MLRAGHPMPIHRKISGSNSIPIAIRTSLTRIRSIISPRNITPTINIITRTITTRIMAAAIRTGIAAFPASFRA